MTTAAGEYTPLHLPPQFAALAALADPSSPFPLPDSPSPPSPGQALPGEAGAGGPADEAPLRKAWRSPPRRVPEHGEAVFLEELGCVWPVPTCGGPSSRKKSPQNSPEGRVGIPFAPAPATVPSDSSQESVSSGSRAPITRSAAVFAHVDPQQRKQQKEEVGMWGPGMQSAVPVPVAAARTELLPSKGNGNPRSPRPHLRPAVRQQQTRPPMQSGHRGRNPPHFLGNGSGHQQQRPRYQRNTGFFPHQQPLGVINDYSYPSAIMGLNPTPEWGFNPSSDLQWGPNPRIAPPRMNTLPPPENMFVRGYFPGPYFPDGLSYCAPPFPPILCPTVGQSLPWFMAPPPPPLTEATLQNQPANLPLPPDDHQLPSEIAQQEDENVSVRLRKQIEYYFSDQNLVKDVYLRTCMDNEGWISVHTIANFPRVQSLTRDVGLILAALQMSPTVEVSGDKMRRKGEWSRWLIRRQPLLDSNRVEPRRDD